MSLRQSLPDGGSINRPILLRSTSPIILLMLLLLQLLVFLLIGNISHIFCFDEQTEQTTVLPQNQHISDYLDSPLLSVVSTSTESSQDDEENVDYDNNDDWKKSWPNQTLSRSKREVFRGQNYHFQRGYELSRLRFENRNKDQFSRPKAFFLREYHQGRDVPKELLHLTQLQKVASVSASVNPDGGNVDTSSHGHGPGDSMKTMSDNYRQRLYATKAALKAALQSGDKDVSILEYLQKISDLKKQAGGSGGVGGSGLGSGGQSGSGGGSGHDGDGNDQGHHDSLHQTKEHGGGAGSGAGGGGLGGGGGGGSSGGAGDSGHGDKDSDLNKNVMFDEQIKEDLDKIQGYDPSKSYGERLRPHGGSGGGGGLSGVGAIGGAGGLIAGHRRQPSNSYLNKLQQLYPHLFPELAGGGGGGNSGGGGAGGRGNSAQGGLIPGRGGGGISGAGGAAGGAGSGGGFGVGGNGGGGFGAGGNGGGGFGSGGIGGGGAFGGPGGNGDGGEFGAGGIGAGGSGAGGSGIGAGGIIGGGGRRGNRTHPYGGGGLPGGTLYPSRFPNNRISALTLYPHIRNSTYPGIPGFVRYDYPIYNSVPFTGFRCDLQSYKAGYFADVRAGCQAFHVCQKDGRMDSFLCPNGTLFHQKVMTCDWWYHVNCPSSPSFYYLNARIGVMPFLPATLGRFD